jgi:pimeloyl-ACP methyl ester carboxylesterase
MKPRPITIEVQPGLRLQGDVFGTSGKPVILLHGGGQTRHSWRRTAEAIAKAGFIAIPMDQRGHGDSDRPSDQSYSFFSFAQDGIAMSKRIQADFGEIPAVVGASLGGLSSLIGTGLQAVAPYAALVLVDVTPRMDENGVAAIQGFMRSRTYEGFATVEEAADAIAAYLPHRPRPKSLDGLRKNLRLKADGRFYWHWDPAFQFGPIPIETDRTKVQAAALAAAAALNIPSMLVRGGGSELVRKEYADEYLALAKGSEFVDVAGARHMVAGDSNSPFTDAVLDFLIRRL